MPSEREFWIEAISEAIEAEGVVATKEQIIAMGSWMKVAHECHTNYCAPVDNSPQKETAVMLEPRQEWWRDRSQLSGADWVLANRIHALINSRYS